MESYYQDNHVTIYNKDCRSMEELGNESVQIVVTSPPYWGLRKYAGLPDLVWGDNHCEHKWQLKNKQTGQKHWNQGGQVIPNVERIIRDGGIIHTGFCSLCGAWKGSYGLEPTPDCGRPFMKLRNDLTPKEKEYVLNELRKLGAI